MIKRILQLPLTKSALILGPRQTGKSTLIKATLASEDYYINLLQYEIYTKYVNNPGILREELKYHLVKHPHFTCFIDEVQRVPQLLNEVHDLIETWPIRFILTGSSARKLKRGQANLLAGRAYTYQLHPLTFYELGSLFELEKALHYGGLPVLWNDKADEHAPKFLQSYVTTYLKEEIQQEGLIRQLPPFLRFLEIAAINDGQLVNFSNIGRECGVSSKTAQAYYEILEDTLLAQRILPWHKSLRKQMINQPKFYFFDTGITNSLCHRTRDALNVVEKGRRFEQWIMLQIIALNHYWDLELELHFWRTDQGHEVDLLLSQSGKIYAAVEIKYTDTWSKHELKGLNAFAEEYPGIPRYALGIGSSSRLIEGNIQVIPWREFFELLPRLTH